MKSLRVLALLGLAFIISVLLAACGGGGSKPAPPPAPLTLTTSQLTHATVNVPYSFVLQATGGTGSYTWGVSSGNLPPGLTLNSTSAQISGTPTTAGVYKFTAKVTDGASTTATADLTLTVEGAIVIKCDSCNPGTQTLPYGNPGTPYSATLSASGGVAPYAWCVVETSGTCDNGRGGALPPGLTIDATTGTISGTPTSAPATPVQFTVQVSDSETIVSRGTIVLSLTIIDLGPKTMPNALLNSPYNQNVSAIGGVAPYTWSLVSGSLPPGLSLGSCVERQVPTCPISGTPTQVGTTTFTLKVVDGENPPAMVSAPVTITVGPLATNSTLNGNYAFSFSGYKNGTPFIMAGAFKANGDGTIADGGKLDYNDGSGEPNDPTQCRGNPNCPIAQVIHATGSSYDLSAGTGQGTMTLATTDNSGNPHTYQFDIAVSGAACTPDVVLNACGRLIETDPQMYGSGALKVQDTDYFTVGAFFRAANFALLASGFDPSSNRYAAVGALGTNPGTLVDIDCKDNGWGLTDGWCPLDQNDNGNGGSGTTVSNTYKGSFSADIDPNSGRGNFLNLSFQADPNGYCPGTLQNPSCGYAYYIVNYQEMILISGDPYSKPANLILWSAQRQPSNATGWTASSIGPNNIMELSADDGGKADVTVGLMASDGTGNGTFASDENDGGTLTNTSAQPGTFSISNVGNKTGQVILGGFPQFGNGGAVMYLYGAKHGNAAFVVGTDAKVTSGLMEPQQGAAGSFSDGSVSGNYEGSTAWPVLSAVTNSATYLHVDGVGNAFGTQYTSGPGGVSGPNDLTLTYSVDGTGRGVVLDQSGNQFGFLYVVAPNKFAMVPTGNNPALNIFFFGQPD